MKRCFGINNLTQKLCLIFLSCGLFAACQTDDESAFQADTAAVQTTSQASMLLRNKQKLSPEQFDRVKKLYEQYPASRTAQDTFRAALIVKEDWAVLVDFFNRIPASKLTVEDKLTLAKVLIKLGRYSDAIDTLQPLTAQNKLEVEILLATAYFHLGKYDDAKTLFDENWQQILNEKKSDEIALRGMIYFYQDDAPKAIETLNKSLEFNAEHVPSYNGLSRVYAAKGERAKAEESLKKVQEIFDRVTANERRTIKIVEKLYKLQDAYQAKRFQEVIDVANDVLPESDAKTKAALYQFQYNSYQALGKQKEAEDVMLKSRQLQQQ